MTTHYEVYFTLYHYNSGDGRNGNHLHRELFHNLKEAQQFRDKLQKMRDNGEETNGLASRYCWDGYLVSVDGIYEVTKKKVG